jgi:HAD superfamily hydrolase (TIGR01549 family)
MTDKIEAILFDMGGTLRTNTKRDDAAKMEILAQIIELVGINQSPAEFSALLKSRDDAYDEWASKNLTELSEADLWTKWMLPDYPAEKIAPIAMQLNMILRDAIATRELLPDSRATVLELYRRGYRIGLVSNTTSSVDAPQALEKAGISGCFETMVLSCVVGKRKPGADILLEAAERMGVQAGHCAYIGDRLDWDVVAARRAGFGKTVIQRLPTRSIPPGIPAGQVPDHFVDRLSELLDIFPALNGKSAHAQAKPVYDISFSTMWGMKKFSDLGDFLLAAPRLGFTKVELNHQVRPSMLEGLTLDNTKINSIHEPCPAVIPVEELKKGDLLISSPNENRRKEGVEAVKRSIDMAHELEVKIVVVHPGQVQIDGSIEKEMRRLFSEGRADSADYSTKRNQFIERRAGAIGPYLTAVKKSLVELLEYAKPRNVRLGLENRFHYLDIPTIDEMGELLDLGSPERLGFLYDIGHAQVQDRYGFAPHEEWLKRYGERIIGVHLHDVRGINDHQAPGLGEVDFKMVAAYLPKTAYRVLEVLGTNTPEQIKAGLKLLLETGCINLANN